MSNNAPAEAADIVCNGVCPAHYFRTVFRKFLVGTMKGLSIVGISLPVHLGVSGHCSIRAVQNCFLPVPLHRE
jgi:hypothetical protein